MGGKFRFVVGGAIAVAAITVAGAQAFAETAGPSPEQAIEAKLEKLHGVRPVAAHTKEPVISVEAASAGQTARAAGLVDYVAAIGKAQLAAFFDAVAQAEAARAAAQAAASSASARNGGGGGGDFFACVRHHESRGEYGVVNQSSGAAGAYQFLPGTWDSTAAHAGRPDLVGVNPGQANAADQDALAQDLHAWQGVSPWAGSGC